jgi:uncharacterized membrane protein YqiK
VLVDGSYYLNRLFGTVELVAKTIIEVGTVGVVVSYTGEHGADLSGEEYRHGELVEPGFRGVWSRPLLPGKYAFNTYAGKIISVPTTNFVLKWTSDATGPHKLDENLSEVGLITKDAFEPLLPLSVVVHIDYMKAPLVVQRFGIMVGGGGRDGAAGGLVEMMLAMLVAEKADGANRSGLPPRS